MIELLVEYYSEIANLFETNKHNSPNFAYYILFCKNSSILFEVYNFEKNFGQKVFDLLITQKLDYENEIKFFLKNKKLNLMKFSNEILKILEKKPNPDSILTQIKILSKNILIHSFLNPPNINIFELTKLELEPAKNYVNF